VRRVGGHGLACLAPRAIESARVACVGQAAAPTPPDGEDIIWNFGKFLVVNGGEVKRSAPAPRRRHGPSRPHGAGHGRYGPRTSPKEIAPDIEAATA
jgi:glutathione peroxidase-family protein